MAYWGADMWLGVGLLLAAAGIVPLHRVTTQVSADAHGLRSRTLLRRRSVPWPDIADLRVYLRYETTGRGRSHRVSLLLRDGRRRLLPCRAAGPPRPPTPRTSIRSWKNSARCTAGTEIRHRTAPRDLVPQRRTQPGRITGHVRAATGMRGPGRGLRLRHRVGRAGMEGGHSVHRRDAREARGECLTTRPAVIARTEANRPKQRSWLYLADSRPLERVAVPQEDALAFRTGDSVELTFWRGEVMEVAGERHVWHEHVPGAGGLAAIAAACVLGAGHPGARVLLRLRGRRLPDDEVLPSALPFVGRSPAPLCGCCRSATSTPPLCSPLRWQSPGRPRARWSR
ncbi:PH domain-containing protein [Streptomyces sp. M10(2022)]